MSKYELTIVLPEGATAAKVKSAKAQVEKIIKTLKGEVKKTDDWGEIALAYHISGSAAGNFVHYKLELEPDAVRAITDKLKMEEGLIRYLLVKE